MRFVTKRQKVHNFIGNKQCFSRETNLYEPLCPTVHGIKVGGKNACAFFFFVKNFENIKKRGT